MALGDNQGGFKYLNIRNGKVSYKEKGAAEYTDNDFVEGIITGIKFEDREFKGKRYVEASIIIVDGDEKYHLQMSTSSGYFTQFCNALRTGDVKKKVKITPWLTDDGERKRSGVFINQDGKALKWYSTKDNPQDVPNLEKVEFDGETKWSSLKQRTYWIEWLKSINWTGEATASMASGGESKVEEKKAPAKKAQAKPVDDEPLFEDNDDLPF